MIFSIPIFIQENPVRGNHPSHFIVRPLFHPYPVEKSEKLHRALNKLSSGLKQLLYDLGHDSRHDALAEWTFDPILREETLELRLELDSGSELIKLFLVGYSAWNRTIYFNPLSPELHFEVQLGQSLKERATEVFTRHFREKQKQEPYFNLHEAIVQGKTRLSTLEVEVSLSVSSRNDKKSKRTLLFGDDEKKDGFKELQKTGRSLSSLYPDDLNRATGRDQEVNELGKYLGSTDRRPLLLVGPHKVGKTAIIHELVWQMCKRRKERFAGGHEIWLLSPMRLISGMSYLGEWENRVMAIVDYAQKKDQVLYFDDLPGLFSAGISCASDLNVAQVIKTALEKQNLRLVAEITPEALRVLRERDRGFMDLFHIIPVPESTEAETYRILIHSTQRLEEQYRCLFAPEVVPVVYELYLRFAAEAAFPGKAVEFLRRLAMRYAGKPIQRKEAYDEFHLQSGMTLALLDGHERLTHESVVQDLQKGLAGQDAVLKAFADVVIRLKTRLNDSRRPLAVMLLLGPTGVGKTESAKVLTRYLFGSVERLLRFDMNEYVDGSSAGRLAGTLNDPEGLLTSAIRRQPFSVLLLDEIEKAAPEVFDILLAVLDEGRLTDTLGRVADFTNSVILLTSNLGVREAGTRLGFTLGETSRLNMEADYVSAAEKFFRPEFFNRIDLVLPFHSLGSGHLEKIARKLIADIFARDGLRRRECMIKVSPKSMAELVKRGSHPQYGARALKRVVESEIAQPLAENLSQLPPGTPTLANFIFQKNQFSLHLEALLPVMQSVSWAEKIKDFHESRNLELFTLAQRQIEAALKRIDLELQADAPTGIIELGKISSSNAHYFSCREQWTKLVNLFQNIRFTQNRVDPFKDPVTAPKLKPQKVIVRQFYGNPGIKRDRLQERELTQSEMEDLRAPESLEMAGSPLLLLSRELALLEAMIHKPWQQESWILAVQTLDELDTELAYEYLRHYRDLFASFSGLSVSYVPKQINEEVLLKKVFSRRKISQFLTLLIQGCNLPPILPEGPSLVLLRRMDGRLGILILQFQPVASEADADMVKNHFHSKHEAQNDSGIFKSLGAVVQLLHENQNITDYRSGMVISANPTGEDFRALLLSVLPLPKEVTV